uniref:Uncharacterized protein n=1 Tax=Panagrolaimus sp. ES5 TaxID=591445 RepID=A0AC34GLJ4_9BILA
MTSGHPVGAQIYDKGYSKLLEFPIIDYYITNSTNITFSFANNETQGDWEGFRGFVSYESEKDYSCPLANKHKPYVFTHDSEVLYMRSSYELNLKYNV